MELKREEARCRSLSGRVVDLLCSIDFLLTAKVLSLFGRGLVDHTVLALAFGLFVGGEHVYFGAGVTESVHLNLVDPSGDRQFVVVGSTFVLFGDHVHGAEEAMKMFYGGRYTSSYKSDWIMYSHHEIRSHIVALIDFATRDRTAAVSEVLPVPFLPELVSRMAGPVSHPFDRKDTAKRKRTRE